MKPLCSIDCCLAVASYRGVQRKNIFFCEPHRSESSIKLCGFSNCKQSASFGRDNIFQRCIDHREPDMTRADSGKCRVCDAQATHDLYDRVYPKYCAEHSRPSFVDFRKVTCSLCEEKPILTYARRKYCPDHLPSGATRCGATGCSQMFVAPPSQIGVFQFCLEHRNRKVVGWFKRVCLVIGCKNERAFSVGETPPQVCFEHSEPGMTRATNQLCKIMPCNKIRAYGFDEPETCKEHSAEGSQKIPIYFCVECRETASFVRPGYAKPIYCPQHKKEDSLSFIDYRKLERISMCRSCRGRSKYWFFLDPAQSYQSRSGWCRNHKRQGMIKMAAYRRSLTKIRLLVNQTLEKLPGYFCRFSGHICFISRADWQYETFSTNTIKIQFNIAGPADINVNIFEFPHGTIGKRFTNAERIDELAYAIESVFEKPGTRFRLFYNATRRRPIEDTPQYQPSEDPNQYLSL